MSKTERVVGRVATLEGARLAAARILAGVGAIFWGFLWYGVIDLLVVVEQDARFYDDYVLESGWTRHRPRRRTAGRAGRRPGDPVAITQLAVVTAAVLIGGLLRPAWPQVLNGLGLLLTVVVIARVGRGRLVGWRRPDPALSVLALVALPTAAAYGYPLIRNTTVDEDFTIGISHWPMQASLALAIVGLVSLAAVTRSLLPGWTAAFAALWLGVELWCTRT